MQSAKHKIYFQEPLVEAGQVERMLPTFSRALPLPVSTSGFLCFQQHVSHKAQHAN